MEYAKIYLCKADNSILGSISGLKAESCSLKKNATDLWEFSFEVDRYIDNNGILIQSDYYDSIDETMKIYFDNNDEQLFFVIDSEPEIHGEEIQETKTITSHSIEVELSHIFLKNFKINCGTDDSQEYLATDDIGNLNNINPYTKLPYEYISFVNYENTQLSLLHLALQGTGWTVKSNIDPEVCSIKHSYDIQSNNIYSFLMNTVSPSSSVIFEFDRKHRQIGAVKMDSFGEDTGVFVSMRNLMNSFDISTSSDSNIKTKIIPSGANSLGIEQVNFGKDYIINLDYFMNTINEYGDYKYVSEELHNKYNIWKKYCDIEKVEFNEKQYTRRDLYIELTKQYNQTILDINELKNRVPNDGALTDYKTFSLEELKLHMNAFNKALVSLITLYKNEYGVSEIGNAPDYTPVPSTAINIKNTPYWYDYYAYQESIIPQIEEALKMYCETDSNGNLITDKNGNYIELEFGNPAYYSNPTIIKEVDAYKYEWSLYGLDELQAKRKAWSEVSNLLFKECFIKTGTISSPIEYRTPDSNGWNSLSDEQKKKFTSKEAYINNLNQYLDYMSFNIRDNSITQNKCIGIIRQCDNIIKERSDEIILLEQKKELYGTQRRELANSVLLENFKINGNFVFTDNDLNTIRELSQEYEYSNDNIVITNLDDIVTTINIQEELYQYAAEKLYEISQPQYSFSTEINNIYALDEFKSYRKSFEIGNFIRVGLETHEELCDINFIKLRIVSITYNPIIADENLSVEFSTMTKSLYGMNDIDFFLSESSSSNLSSSSSSSGTGGTYGNNDANVQMSNNMINALLSTELFGTTVTDVILDSIKGNKGNFNTLLSHSGVFDSLEAGQIKISGECLFDIVKSSNFVDGKSGSMLNLTDGSFSFAAGALTYNPQSGLIIKGMATDSSLQSLIDNLANGTTIINGSCITTGLFKSSNWNGSVSNPIGNTQGSIICLSDGKFNFGGGNLKWDGTNLLINGNGKFTGEIIGTSGTFNGNITATTLTANQSGTIAGWTFDENGFYKEKSTIACNNGMYLGDNGISVNDYFVVNQNGLYFKSKHFTPQYYNTEISQMRIKHDEYIRVYLYNMGSIEYFNLSFQFNYFKVQEDSIVSILNAYVIRGWGTDGRTTPPDSIMEYDGNDVKIFYQPYSELFPADADEDGVCDLRCYSYGRTINGRWFDAVQIGKVEICNSNGSVLRTYNGTKVSGYNGFMINSYTKHILSDNYFISNENFIHTGVYSDISTSSPNVLINSDGRFMRSSSSSKRYKKDITSNIPNKLDPKKLYDLNIVSYKYKDDYLHHNDQRYMHDTLGFIAEDVYEKYPVACNLNEDGKPEMWEINILFPAALKLIQEQHKEIDSLKEQLVAMKQQFQELKTSIFNQIN